jgi:RNA polymerase-binding transcription factor DksA
MELAKIKKRLQTDLQETKEEIQRLTALIEGEEVSEKFFTREMNINRKEQAVNELGILCNALERIETGTYEICAQCGNRIKPERLEILPTTTLCLNCATKQSSKTFPIL